MGFRKFALGNCFSKVLLGTPAPVSLYSGALYPDATERMRDCDLCSKFS